MAVDQMLIFFACECQKKTSLIHIRPPPAAATLNMPFKMRDAMYDSKLLAAADQAAVPAERHPNQKRTGRRPK